MEYFIPLKTSVESPEPCICKISWMTTGTNESPIWGHESGSGRQVKMWLVHRSLKRRLTLPSISRPCDFRAAYKKGFWGITTSLPRSESSRDLLIREARKKRKERASLTRERGALITKYQENNQNSEIFQWLYTGDKYLISHHIRNSPSPPSTSHSDRTRSGGHESGHGAAVWVQSQVAREWINRHQTSEG